MYYFRINSETKWSWSCKTVPLDKNTQRRPKNLPDYLQENHRVLLEGFHAAIAADPEAYEDVFPIPPWSIKNVASAYGLIGYAFPHLVGYREELIEYDCAPGFHGRGHSLYGDSEIWTPTEPWEAGSRCTQSIPAVSLLNHCLYYGLHVFSYLAYLRREQELWEGLKPPLYLRDAPATWRAFLTGELRFGVSDQTLSAFSGFQSEGELRAYTGGSEERDIEVKLFEQAGVF